MKFQELLETPQIVGSTDFGLSNDDANRAMALRLLKKKQETLEDHPGYELFLTGNMVNGYIALYVKNLQMLGYVIKYKAEKRKLVGGTVSQIMLWRRPLTPHVPGITRHVFFDYLLTQWTTIMSDAKQTPEGAQFWGNRLAEASTGSYDVGFVDFGRNYLNWWNGIIPFSDWIKENEAWGEHHKFQALRYIIRRN